MLEKELDTSVMRVNTEKFKAVTFEKKSEENLMTISTARRSSIEARVLCSRCNTRVKREDIYNCETCGSMVCNKCLANLGKKQEAAE